MKASRNYEKLNKHFESCLRKRPDGKIEAYLCPANVWTIGWGSTRNMDTGVAVKEGDVIDQATADRWFSLETAEKSKGVAALLPIILTQDQFDACVCFAYNIGLGAFRDSTFRKRLLAGEDKATVAREEMPRWNKGDGQVLQGLIRRRNAEVALFCGDYAGVKTHTNGQVVLSREEPTPEPVRVKPTADDVTWIQPFIFIPKSTKAPISEWQIGLAAKIRGSDETLTLARIPLPSEFIADFLAKYPNAESIVLAEPSKPWPGDEAKPEPKPEPVGEVFLKVTRVAPGRLNADGLEDLKLELMGTNEPSWRVQSGRVGKQVFEIGGQDSGSGTGFPCPQGEYVVRDFRWYGGKDNWNASGGAGLGPMFIPFDPKFNTGRGAFGIHWDSNHPKNTAITRESPSAGSAGCLVHLKLDEHKRLAAALRKYDPRRLSVQWGL